MLPAEYFRRLIMRKDIIHYYNSPLENVHKAYFDAAQQRFGKDLRESSYTVQFGINMSLPHNLEGGACTVHLMPYQDGTAAYLCYNIAQVMDAHYTSFDSNLSGFVCQSLGVQLMNVDLPLQGFLDYASGNGDRGDGIISESDLEDKNSETDHRYQTLEQQAQYLPQTQQPAVPVQQPQTQMPAQTAYTGQGYAPQPEHSPKEMLQRKRIGLIIWGAILLGIGLIVLAGSAGSGYMRIPTTNAGTFIGLGFIVGGGLMLGFGIKNAVSVTSHNSKIINDGLVHITPCPYCGAEIRAKSSEFRPHSRFPEGYIYCRVCKKPVSRNAFDRPMGAAAPFTPAPAAPVQAGPVFVATCFSCKNEIRARANEFQTHHNFPEGFKYCPVCKKPISRSTFDTMIDPASPNTRFSIYTGDVYTTTCYGCGNTVRAQENEFRPHRNFPEGFKYCPSCRKPISRNSFVLQNFDNSIQ